MSSKIDGVPAELLRRAYWELDAGTPSIATLAELKAVLEAPVVERQEPLALPDLLRKAKVQLGCYGPLNNIGIASRKTLIANIEAALSENAEIAAPAAEYQEPVYQTRWNRLGEWDEWKTVSQEQYQRSEGRLFERRTLYTSPPAPVAVAQHPFADKVISKLKRFEECVSDFDADGVDIGRHWLDLLTQLALLNRVQRSPALWEITQQGEDCLDKVKEMNQ